MYSPEMHVSLLSRFLQTPRCACIDTFVHTRVLQILLSTEVLCMFVIIMSVTKKIAISPC